MSIYDDPNREVLGLDPAWVEGSGGEGGTAPETQTGDSSDLDAMSKEQLLELAASLGVTPANAGMTKDEIRAGIDAKLAEGG